ncbi:MAG: DUF885 family protein [Candidatus Omnitrophica bacterium]|nr:DUF885 family protein [Candidatus Omnitrophota bacterium]
MKDTKTDLKRIADDYFGYMARAYPVMCLSDEFYFLPRAEGAMKFLTEIDSLDSDKIAGDIRYIKGLQKELQAIDPDPSDLDARIDLVMLNESISLYLEEFETTQIYRRDPALYINILMLGVDHLITKLSSIVPEKKKFIEMRLKKIPRLLDEAKRNLKDPPLPYVERGLQMAEAARLYLISHLPHSKELDKVLEKIEEFKDLLHKLAKGTDSNTNIVERAALESILKNGYSYNRPLEEIFQIAKSEYKKVLDQMDKIASDASPKKEWQAMLLKYKLPAKDPGELLSLYAGQIDKLRGLTTTEDLVTLPYLQNILVVETPKYLAPVRASASYSCPLTMNEREAAYFYISIFLGEVKSKFENIHQEYIFVSAHETYPGHHLLDTIRRSLENPIRRQIESPFFYEGWASYAEELIAELGYVKTPEEKLIGLRRQAWRAIRAMLDVGTRINKLTHDEGGRMLTDIGYSRNVVKAMITHYSLTYGYQLCYTIGKFELEQLKKEFVSKLGLKKFHDTLLYDGQIPFDLCRERMKRL